MKGMYRGVVMAVYEERAKVIAVLKESGYEMCRNGKHGTIYKKDGKRINVPFKLGDRNHAKKILRPVGLELA